jgi:hypothetical protein
VMEEYTAQQNLLIIESQRMHAGRQTRRDVPRAPASESAVSRSALCRRLSDGRGSTTPTAQVDTWRSVTEDSETSRLDRTVSGALRVLRHVLALCLYSGHVHAGAETEALVPRRRHLRSRCRGRRCTGGSSRPVAAL